MASLTVTVMVDVSVSSATTPVVGVAVAVELAALMDEGSPTNPTVGCCVTTTWLGPGLMVAVMVLVSAVVEAIVKVATPVASLTTEAGAMVLFDPVEASCTV